LKRFTHAIPVESVANPAFRPACDGGSVASSTIAWITDARITKFTGSVRALASRAISFRSSLLNSRNRIRFGIIASFVSETIILRSLAEKTTKWFSR
jgi:hypothetical protein